jgi:glycosyltransferase involved in cell wall biosynthesis
VNKKDSALNKAIISSAMKDKINPPRRILWVSNAPWASTGYGQQTAQVIPRLKKDNNDVAIVANYGLEASTTTWNTPTGPVPIYPRGMEQWSNDVIPAHMHDWTSRDKDAENLLITLFDVWVFKGEKWGEWPVASWTPVDHVPAPPDVSAWCRLPNVYPIAMSKFGKAMFENVGIESWYVPHAVEKVFKPTEKIVIADGQTIDPKDFMRLPKDRFVVGMNAANKGVMPNRKAFGENLLAFSIFAKQYDDAILYIHTDASGSMGGIRLMDLILSVGIPVEKVVFADPYLLRTGLSQEAMAAIYSQMNVLLATSYGEGFGIPTVEAQACGVPVIVSDFAASAELCGDGWKIGGQPLWDAPQKSFFHIPNVPEITEALTQAYNRTRGPSQKAIDFAKQYDADLVYETQWKPTLDSIFSRVASDRLNKPTEAK